jgi:hypothetical protein
MRGGATSGKSFNEGCEEGLPHELEVDLSEAWVDCSSGSADWSDFKLLIADELEASGVVSLTGLTLGP